MLRPSVNACGARSVLAISRAPGGVVHRSWCHWNHGPGSTSSGASVSTAYQPISASGARSTVPPSAVASA